MSRPKILNGSKTILGGFKMIDKNEKRRIRVKYNNKYGTLVSTDYNNSDIKVVMIIGEINNIHYSELDYSDEPRSYSLEVEKVIDDISYIRMVMASCKARMEEIDKSMEEIYIPF